MFYQEKIEVGVAYYRTAPGEDWRRMTLPQVINAYLQLQQEFSAYKQDSDRCYNCPRNEK